MDRAMSVVSSEPSFSMARAMRLLWMDSGVEWLFRKAAWMCFSHTPSMIPSEQMMNWSPCW